MSPEADEAPAVGEAALDAAIERGIDSLARLRADMRQAGFDACADGLDEAFVACLAAYVARRRRDGSTFTGPGRA